MANLDSDKLRCALAQARAERQEREENEQREFQGNFSAILNALGIEHDFTEIVKDESWTGHYRIHLDDGTYIKRQTLTDLRTVRISRYRDDIELGHFDLDFIKHNALILSPEPHPSRGVLLNYTSKLFPEV